MGKNKFLDAILNEYYLYQPFKNSQKEVIGGNPISYEENDKLKGGELANCSELMKIANNLSDKLRNIKNCSSLITTANDLSNKLKGLLNEKPVTSDINKGKQTC